MSLTDEADSHALEEMMHVVFSDSGQTVHACMISHVRNQMQNV